MLSGRGPGFFIDPFFRPPPTPHPPIELLVAHVIDLPVTPKDEKMMSSKDFFFFVVVSQVISMTG